MRIAHHGIPAGVFVPFAGNVAPHGWLLCDGSIVSRNKYVALFNAIGTIWGAGDGETTFHVPDLRGLFVRGADDMGTGPAGRDPNSSTRTALNSGGQTGDKVGSFQADSFQGHEHNNSGYFGPINVEWGNDYKQGVGPTNGIVSNGVNGTPRVSDETRGKNVNGNYIIKI